MNTDITTPKAARSWPEIRKDLLDAIGMYGEGCLAPDELLRRLVFHAEELL